MTTQKEQVKRRFLFNRSVEDAGGYQTFRVDAHSLDEAWEILRAGDSDMHYCEVDVTHLGEPEFDQETTLDDYGDFPPIESARPSQAAACDDDLVLVPRGLIGAACSAIDKKRDALKVLEQLRRYTFGDLSQAASDDSRRGDAPNITAEEMDAFSRFCDTCEDSEEYDVSKDKMRRLARIGLVRWCGGSRYETTEFGDAIRNETAQPRPVEPVAFSIPDTYVTVDDGRVKFKIGNQGFTLDYSPTDDDDFTAIQQLYWMASALRSALSKLVHPPQPSNGQPVAWIKKSGMVVDAITLLKSMGSPGYNPAEWTPLYAAPQPGADAELIETLRNALDWIDKNNFGGSDTLELMDAIKNVIAKREGGGDE